MQTRIGVLVVMLDKGKSTQNTSRPLNILEDTEEYIDLMLTDIEDMQIE